MSLGYCNTFVTDLNPENTNRNLLDAGLPSRFKLQGVLFNPTEKYSSGATANTIETFRIYDGDSDDGLIYCKDDWEQLGKAYFWGFKTTCVCYENGKTQLFGYSCSAD